MTAIVGFNCPDGVVIAADTEETYEDNKAYTHKLFPVERPKSRLCVAGAGIGYLIDYAKDKIVSMLDSGASDNEFEAQLSITLDGLYKKEFRRFPVGAARELQIQLLVGVQFATEADPATWAEPRLFECQSNLVMPIKRQRSCAMGTGALLKEATAQFAHWGLDVSLAEWASIYVIYEAKRRFGGVGGKTHIFTMKRDGNPNYHLGRKLPEKEEVLASFAGITQLLMLSLDPSVTNDKAKDLIKAVTGWQKSTRQYLQRLERQKTKHFSITIGDRRVDKMLRHVRSAMRSVAQRSEPEQ